jgi:hypothetical protein
MHPRSLSAGDLLVAYEQQPLQPAWRWPAVLLTLGYAQLSVDAAVNLPLPKRERLLLILRRSNFGDAMRAQSRCGACGSDNEINLSCDALLTAFPNTEGLESDSGPVGWSLTVLPSGVQATLQSLSAFDLAEASHLPATKTAHFLQEHSLKSLEKSGQVLSWEQLNLEDQNALTQALESLSGGIRLEVICSACGGKENRDLDLGLWIAQDVSRATRKVLQEVDTLARAYGWSESDILNLSNRRRQLYLEMVA